MATVKRDGNHTIVLNARTERRMKTNEGRDGWHSLALELRKTPESKIKRESEPFLLQPLKHSSNVIRCQMFQLETLHKEEQQEEHEKDAFEEKLVTAVQMLSPWLGGSRTRTGIVVAPSNYRSRCVYQVIVCNDDSNRFNYAKRVNHEPFIIAHCSIANKTISGAMKTIRHFFQQQASSTILLQHLDAISFSSSWEDDPMTADCLVTFHYSKPILDAIVWKLEANALLQQTRVKQITGRSKKRMIRAKEDDEESTIKDTLYLVQREQPIGGNVWNVFAGKTNLQAFSKTTTCSSSNAPTIQKTVHYVKPEGAFSHPNSSVMCRALEWILSRLSAICQTAHQPLYMTELYCGFGAHTLAIQQAAMDPLVEITAVELDPRLIEALYKNIALNDTTATTKIRVVQGDANQWTKKQSDTATRVDILLVDPPRQGLDVNVTNMLMRNTSIAHCLYVSCGRDALMRDLQILGEDFLVKDSLVLDLFPQTSAVETLVHLVRRRRTNNDVEP